MQNRAYKQWYKYLVISNLVRFLLPKMYNCFNFVKPSSIFGLKCPSFFSPLLIEEKRFGRPFIELNMLTWIFLGGDHEILYFGGGGCHKDFKDYSQHTYMDIT